MKLDEKQLNELTTNNPYAYKDTVIEIIDKIDIDKITIQELYDMYLEYKDKYQISVENSKKCQIDYFYWCYVADSETYQYLYEFMAQQCINKVNPNDCEIGALKYNTNELVKLHENINRTIKDLEIYKPTNYKKMIELLHNLTRH